MMHLPNQLRIFTPISQNPVLSLQPHPVFTASKPVSVRFCHSNHVPTAVYEHTGTDRSTPSCNLKLATVFSRHAAHTAALARVCPRKVVPAAAPS